MTAVASWEVPFILDTPQGNLDLNTPVVLPSAASGEFVLIPRSCKAAIPLRATDSDVPQQDGEVTHRRFYKGFLMNLAIGLFENRNIPACDSLLQEMLDNLMKHVRALTCPPADPNDGRVYWTPAGQAQRMIRNAILNEPADVSLAEGGITVVEFQLKSPFPYAWDAAETTTTITSGNSATLTNSGTADFWPVIRVKSTSGTVTITNNDDLDDDGSPKQIIYDSSFLGVSGANYGEIDTYDGTMFYNGSSTNMTPGFDVASTDMFQIKVGSNDIDVTGATIDILWQNAWA